MKKALIALAGLALSAAALGQLSKHKDWAKSPEAYFLTPGEREEWSKIQTDEEAEKFIALYWAKRDPNPATAANEFRNEIGRRIAAAEEQFKMRRQRGAESARGRLLVTLGPPSRVTQSRAQEGAVDDRGGVTAPSIDTRPDTRLDQSTAVQTTWIYAKDKFDPSLEIGELRARISVDPLRGSDDLQGGGPVEKVIAKIAEKTIVNPNPQAAAATGVAPMAPSVPPAATGAGTGTASPPAPVSAPPASSSTSRVPGAPAPSTAASAPVAAAPAPAGAASLPAATRSALESLMKGKKADSSFWGGTFRSVSDEPFFAFQLYVPAEKASSLPAAGLKFGGIVVNESGKEVASFWEDASLSDMKTGTKMDKVFERSIVVPVGSYRGSFGLFPAEGTEALVASSAEWKLESPRPNEFAVSPLILANTLTPLTRRPGPTDPFVFGVEKPIRVEPKGNRLFTKEDGLWYFYTVANPTVPAAPPLPAATPTPSTTPAPGATPAAAAAPPPAAAAEGPKPRILTRISVLRDGQAAFAPLTAPAELQPLRPGYYAGGSEIPLASFEPGYYTFGLLVRDLAAPKDSAANKGIERKEDFVVLNADGSLPAKSAAKAPEKPAAAKPKPTPKKP